MVVLLYFILFVLTSKISTISSQEAESHAKDQNGPGESACSLFGWIEEDCNLTAVTLNNLPTTCTSFFFDGLTIDRMYQIKQEYGVRENDLLDEILSTGKKVYVDYGYPAYFEWSLILACMACAGTNAVDESKSINAFKKQHPGITGLLLKNLQPEVIFEPFSKEFVGMTENLKKYIEVLKEETKLEIGLSIFAEEFMLFYESPPFPWLDFQTLDSSVDFYEFSMINFFNECSEESSDHSTRVPLNGNEQFTLEKLRCAIEQSKIPKKKIYYTMVLRPVPAVTGPYLCWTSYQTVCTSPQEGKSFCADTQEDFFEKGKWIRQNGAGFIGYYIDLDDPENCCSCGPYPSFNAILAGIEEKDCVPKCPLYDRQP